jgi:hypothetical protein
MVTKRAPVPLATLEMCKSAGSHLRIAGGRAFVAMRVAAQDD